MSHFISMYDVVFGTRSTEESDTETDAGKLESRYGNKYRVDPVDLTKVVCAIEDESVNSYCFDDFGRFGLIKHDDEGGAKARVKVLLSGYARASLLEEPRELDEYERSLADFDESPEWHTFGWMGDELPDFEECYQQWKSEHNPSGEEPTLRIKRQEYPRKNNTVWGMAEGLIRMVITDHLSSKSQSTDEFVAELMSKTNSTNTMKLFSELQKLAPDFFAMDEATFRKQLKNIFGK